MKNLLVPAAIAIGGLFVVSHLERTNSADRLCTPVNKTEKARHNRNITNHSLTAPINALPANTVSVASFASLTETILPSFFIDFSNEQTALSDAEISHQMEDNLVEISLPETKEADAEITENFTAN